MSELPWHKRVELANIPTDTPSRYHRQQLLNWIGEDGQARISSGHALIVGVGALGTVLADSLCRAGVGELTLVDRDIVEWTNLQRQVLFDEADAREGKPKAHAAREKLGNVNASVRINAVADDFNHTNAERLCALNDKPVDVIVDGTDNFRTRFLLNDLAVKLGVPYVYGGAVGTSGTVMNVLAGVDENKPCLRCVLPDEPGAGSVDTCDTAGVLGPLIHVVAGMQAAETLKILAGRIDLCVKGVRSIDLLTGAMRTLAEDAQADPDCPCCGHKRFEFLSGERSSGTASLCGRGAVQVLPDAESGLDLDVLCAKLTPHGEFKRTKFNVRGTLSVEKLGLTVFPTGRALVHDTSDPVRARSVYDRYVGS